MSAVRHPFDQTVKAIIANIDKALAENRRQQEEIQRFPKPILNDEAPLWDEHTKKSRRLVFPMEEALAEIYGGVQRFWRERNDQQLVKALQTNLNVPQGEDVHAAAEAALQPGGSGINWEKVAEEITGGFDAQETKNRYLSVLHPSANTGPWSREEELLLLSIIEQNPKDWNEVALQLGTNRTGFQVFQRYRQSLSNLLLSEWTFEQDYQLKQLAESSKVANGGRVNWQKVAQAMDRRTPSQCSHRYEMSLADDQYTKSTWSDEETNQILRLHRVFGPRWRKIAEFMPNRKEMQIRCHYMHTLLPQLNRGDCTEEEASKLVMLIKKFGPGDWSRIAAEIPNRTDKWVRSMFARLMPNENDIYHQLLARKAYCNLPKNVSSSRKRANLRPKVTAAEFTVPVLPSFEDATKKNLETLELTGHPETDRLLKCTNNLRKLRQLRAKKNNGGKQVALEDGNAHDSALATETASDAAPSSLPLATKPECVGGPRSPEVVCDASNAIDSPQAVPDCSHACKREIGASSAMSDAASSCRKSNSKSNGHGNSNSKSNSNGKGISNGHGNSNSKSNGHGNSNGNSNSNGKSNGNGISNCNSNSNGNSNSYSNSNSNSHSNSNGNSAGAPLAKRRKEMSESPVAEESDAELASDAMCGDASSRTSQSAPLAKRRKETPRADVVVTDTGVASLTTTRVDDHTATTAANRSPSPRSASTWRSDSAGRSFAKTRSKTPTRTRTRPQRKTASPTPADAPSTNTQHIAFAESVDGGASEKSRDAKSSPKRPLPVSRDINSCTRPKRAALDACNAGPSDPKIGASSTSNRVQRVTSGILSAISAPKDVPEAGLVLDEGDVTRKSASSLSSRRQKRSRVASSQVHAHATHPVPDEGDAARNSASSSSSSSRTHARPRVASLTLHASTVHLTAAAVLEHDHMTHISPRAKPRDAPTRLSTPPQRVDAISANDREHVQSPSFARNSLISSLERRSDCDTLLSFQCDTDSLSSSCNPQCGDGDATVFSTDAMAEQEGTIRNQDFISYRSAADVHGNPQAPVWNEEINAYNDPYLLADVSDGIDSILNSDRTPYCLDDDGEDEEAEAPRISERCAYDLDSLCDEDTENALRSRRESDGAASHAGNSYCFDVGNLTAC